MIQTLTTLIRGADARATDRLRDHFALDLIDQRLRDAAAGLQAAKLTLATLIQRDRSEARQSEMLAAQIADLTARTKAALAARRMDLAEAAAQALADLENEQAVRATTRSQLATQIARLRTSVAATQRRIIDLRQGALQARAVRHEQDVQGRLHRSLTPAPADEAAELIARVLNRDDPVEQAQILAEINQSLDHTGIAGRLADAGFGALSRTTARMVLDRLAVA